MCTLMMKAGWSLKYSFHGKNTTFCPEETEEFMKQRRRWLLSDFTNAAVVAGNLCELCVWSFMNILAWLLNVWKSYIINGFRTSCTHFLTYNWTHEMHTQMHTNVELVCVNDAGKWAKYCRYDVKHQSVNHLWYLDTYLLFYIIT